MKRFTLLILPLIFLTAFCFQTKLISKEKYKCVLISDKKIYKIGELPKIQVEIINQTNEDIYLMGSLDGSDFKGRMPYCFFDIIKPVPDTIVSFGGCGTHNPLRKEDFVKIRPTDKFDPYGKINNYGFFGADNLNKKTFRNKGIYKIQFHYSTNSDNILKYLGAMQWSEFKDSTELKTLFAEVPKIDIVSNQLEIKFEE